MGKVLVFDPLAGHAVAGSASTLRSAGMCILAKDSYVTPGTPTSRAPAITRSQYSTGMEPLRFCSPAVEGLTPIARANLALPPKASIREGTEMGVQQSDIPSVYRNPVKLVNRTSVYEPCLFADMGNSSDRLKAARERAGFKSARAAAIKNGWVPSTYASHENGQTPEVPLEAAMAYGRAFRVSPSWILTGEGAMDAQNLVRVMGRIGAGAEITPDLEQVPDDGLDEVELPVPIGADAVAFEVAGNSMAPRYDPGTLIICSTRPRDAEQFLGYEVAVRTADGRRYLKKLRPGTRRGIFTLESFNAEPIENAKVVWIGEILAVIPAARRARMKPAARRAG